MGISSGPFICILLGTRKSNRLEIVGEEVSKLKDLRIVDPLDLGKAPGSITLSYADCCVDTSENCFQV